jgi:hypothetical protein
MLRTLSAREFVQGWRLDVSCRHAGRSGRTNYDSDAAIAICTSLAHAAPEHSPSPSAVVPTASPRPYVVDSPATATAPRTKLAPLIVSHDKRRSRMARRDIDEDGAC